MNTPQPWYKTIEGLSFIQEYPSEDPNRVLVLYHTHQGKYVVAVLNRSHDEGRYLTIQDNLVCTDQTRQVFRDMLIHDGYTDLPAPQRPMHIHV